MNNNQKNINLKIEEYKNHLEESSKENIPNLINQGILLLDEEKHELWKQCVNEYYNEYYGLLLEVVLIIIRDLKDNKDIKDIIKFYYYHVENTMNDSLAKSIILLFSNQGKYFLEHISDKKVIKQLIK